MNNGKVEKLTQKTRDEIMDGVLALGAEGERVLALAELVLNKDIYNINIPEPKCSKTTLNDIDESYDGQDIIIVFGNDLNDNEGKKYEIPVNFKDKDGNKLKFENTFIYQLKGQIQSKTGAMYDSIRLFYGDTSEALAGDSTLSDNKIKQGSILYGYIGPYQFKKKKSK